MTGSRFDGTRYRNPGPPASRSLADLMRWQATADRRPWPSHVPLDAPGTPPATVAPGTLAATFVNHATFVLQSRRLAILTDPIWSERASPVGFAGPRRVHAPGVPFE